MSKTEHYTRPALQFYPKQLKHIVDCASRLVANAKEPNYTVRTMAEVVIGDFADIVAEYPKLTFSEGIAAAKELSATPPNQPATWEHSCGSAMAKNALELAAKIEMHTISYSKALMQMNRTITYRERAHEQRARSNEISASLQRSKSAAPVSITERKNAKPSRKRQPAKARRRSANAA
ncbi:MAG TPA: hypothetical protein VN081_01810 [Dongiaceae bacterium]|nr:hypothetical protein [Dongiaceae bacterium]